MQTDNIKKQGYYRNDNNFICYRWLAISVFCSVLPDYIRRRLIFVSKGVCFTCFAPLSWCVGINFFDCNRLVAKVLWWIVIFFWCKSLPIQKKVVLLHPISREKSSNMSRIRLVVQDNCLSRSRSPVRLWYAVRKRQIQGICRFFLQSYINSFLCTLQKWGTFGEGKAYERQAFISLTFANRL